ncbi:MAG: RNA polymerase sigma factor [Tahibacter sp.]
MNDRVIDDTRKKADELLVVRCQLGEALAFNDLIAHWHGPLSSYVQRQSLNETTAADVVQDIWLRVFRSISSLRDGRNLRAWLFGIARRAWMDHLRGRYAAPMGAEIDIDTEPSLVTSGEEEVQFDREFVHKTLARLPSVEREVLILFYLEELTQQEIAQVIGVPMGTVKSRLFRARALCREEIESNGGRP